MKGCRAVSSSYTCNLNLNAGVHAIERTRTHPKRDQDTPPLRHMRDPSACMRNPALRNLEVPSEEVYAAMDVRNDEADGGRYNGRDFWCFLHASVKGATCAGSNVHRTWNTSGALPRSCMSLTGTSSKNGNCLHWEVRELVGEAGASGRHTAGAAALPAGCCAMVGGRQ